MKKRFFFIFRIIVSAAILFALFKFVPYQHLIEIYKEADKVYILYGFLVFLLCNIAASFRWRFLLSSLGVKISARETLYAFFSGLFFNLFFPSFVAGDVFRGFSVSYRHGQTQKVASSVLMDRFSGATALTLLALISFIAGRKLMPAEGIAIPLGVLCLILLFASAIIFSRRFFSFLIQILGKENAFKKKLISFHGQLYFFRQNPRVFLKSMLFSFPIQVLGAMSFFVVSKAFGLTLGPIYFLVLVPIVIAIALIPITIAGAGTREAASVYFFSLLGVDKGVGLSISLLNLVFMVSLGILGGIIYVSLYHRWLQRRT